MSEWWSRHFKNVDGLTPHTVFHSLRKRTIQELMEHRIDGYLISQIVGHTDTNITTGGYGRPVEIEQLREIVELLDFSAEVDALRVVGSR